MLRSGDLDDGRGLITWLPSSVMFLTSWLVRCARSRVLATLSPQLCWNIRYYADLIADKYYKLYATALKFDDPTQRVFGFIDGTFPKMSRPDALLEWLYYSGYKKCHAVRVRVRKGRGHVWFLTSHLRVRQFLFVGLLTPDGILHLQGAFPPCISETSALRHTALGECNGACSKILDAAVLILSTAGTHPAWLFAVSLLPQVCRLCSKQPMRTTTTTLLPPSTDSVKRTRCTRTQA